MNKLEQMLERMIYIRSVEEEIADRYKEQEMRCPIHLSIGQEAPAAAVGLCLRPTDYVVSTHRGHAHYLACGGSLNAMIAELHGKSTGCSRGRGGSMHLIDTSVGFMGTTAIVGNSISIGMGLGKAIQLNEIDAVSCVFLGDAAIETGSFYESVNFAASAKLPVMFICENNLYSVYTPIELRQPVGRKIYEMVCSLGIKSLHGDGNNAVETLAIIEEAVEFIRSGQGPCFVELSTYRWREHCGPNYDNDLAYRALEEFRSWKDRDPIKSLESFLDSNQIASEKINFYKKQFALQIKRAFDAAKLAPFPDYAEAFQDEYAN